jgi:hypothetical protein
MKKSTSFLWRMLVAVILVFSLTSVLSIQATISAPATVSAATPGCPKTPITPTPANLSTTSVFTGLAWAATTNATLWDVYWDTDDDGDPSDDLMVASQIGNPYLDPSDLMTALSTYVGDDVYALDACETYYWQVVAWNTSSGDPTPCSNTSKIWQFTTGPMIGAVTGWTWEFTYATVQGGGKDDDPTPYNTNTRDSIMVVFDGYCFDDADLDDYINASAFRVTYDISLNGRLQTVVNETPKAVVIHDWYETDYEYGDTDDDYTLVFLTVAKPMATSAEPIVRLMDGRTQFQAITADDGIAPIIDLSITGSPYQGGEITVTATATEPLEDAFIVTTDEGCRQLPTINFFPAEVQEPDEYGGYCYYDNEFDEFGYTEMRYMYPDENVADYTFKMEAQDPQETFFVEVYAHDDTWCDGYYSDGAYKWWRHEKWSSASQVIQSQDTIVLKLVEGWNLISFPRTPVDPTLRGVFGDNIVNKVYTYSAGRWYGSIYDADTGNWKTPTGLNALTTIGAGVGYWVYCSNAGVDQDFFSYYLEEIASYYSTCDELDAEVAWTDLIVEVQPAAVGPVTPPSYALSAGWNLVGVPVQGSLDAYQIKWNDGYSEIHHAPVTMVSDFMASVGDKWKALYWYLPTYTLWCDDYDESYTFPSGYQIATPGTPQSDAWKMAYWMSAFGSLGISDFPQDVPDWVIAQNTLGFSANDYESNDYTYNDCGSDATFWFDTWGYTDSGDEIEISIDGYVDSDTGQIYGWDDGDSEVYNSNTGNWEDISFTFTSGSEYWYNEDDFDMTVSFNGTTDSGRTITGMFVIEWYYYSDNADCEYYYYIDDINFEGTITDENFIGNFDIDAAKIATPVVMPGYGYWVWMDSAGTLIPAVATATGSGLDIGGPL